ncbi:unnamed protein product [Linum trigynum]|uniref:DUF4283 domain-containing protein n=1 Tax=Linum trigynum TaxID=586398 RepID=A0AAV2CG64_9ROSI
MRDWKFGKEYIKRSGERVIHVGRTALKNKAVLQISEMVATGRVFKVLISEPDGKKGWASLIDLLQDFYTLERRAMGSYLERPFEHLVFQPPSGQQVRTFAEVVKSGGFYGAGKCCIKGSRRDRFIEVGDEGVQNRQDLMGKCLEIQLSSKSINICTQSTADEFKRWANKKWAIDSNYGWIDKGIGKWMLICPSWHQAMRVRSFDQCSFQNLSIIVSYWKEESRGDASDTMWILVTGIPCHLKSVDLIKEIEKFCGFLVEVDWNHWSADFIRIRVRVDNFLPDCTPILFAGRWYRMKVVRADLDEASSLLDSQPRRVSMRLITEDEALHGNGRSRGCMTAGTGSEVRFPENSNRKSGPPLSPVGPTQRGRVKKVLVRKFGPIWAKPSEPFGSGMSNATDTSCMLVGSNQRPINPVLDKPTLFPRVLSSLTLTHFILNPIPHPIPNLQIFSWLSSTHPFHMITISSNPPRTLFSSFQPSIAKASPFPTSTQALSSPGLTQSPPPNPTLILNLIDR